MDSLAKELNHDSLILDSVSDGRDILSTTNKTHHKTFDPTDHATFQDLLERSILGLEEESENHQVSLSNPISAKPKSKKFPKGVWQVARDPQHHRNFYPVVPK